MSSPDISLLDGVLVPDSAPSAAKEECGLEWSLLAYFSSITLLITLVPFRFQWPPPGRYLWMGGWFDALSNVLLFLPLGFFYQLTRKLPGRLRHVFCLGLCASAAIELCQFFLPGRYPSPADVLTNALGAWLGAWMCDWAQRTLKLEWVSTLGLQLPLMNVVYLLVPLIWLNGLASGGDGKHSTLSGVLGLCGSIVIGGVYQNGMREPRLIKLRVLAVIAAAWFLASSIPAFMSSGSPLLFSPVVALSACLFAVLPVFAGSPERRFEIPVLKVVFPLYAGFLVLLFLWPLPSHFVKWHGSVELIELADDPDLSSVLGLMEDFAAFTLFGYMVAEFQGRRGSAQTPGRWWGCFWCALSALLLEAVRGLHPDHNASLMAGLITLTGGLYGMLIYSHQLSGIQRLLRTTSVRGPTIYGSANSMNG